MRPEVRAGPIERNLSPLQVDDDQGDFGAAALPVAGGSSCGADGVFLGAAVPWPAELPGRETTNNARANGTMKPKQQRQDQTD